MFQIYSRAYALGYAFSKRTTQNTPMSTYIKPIPRPSPPHSLTIPPTTHLQPSTPPTSFTTYTPLRFSIRNLTPTMKDPLTACLIALTGDFGPTRSLPALKKWIEANGGKVAKAVSPKTTHLVCSKEAWKKQTATGKTPSLIRICFARV